MTEKPLHFTRDIYKSDAKEARIRGRMQEEHKLKTMEESSDPMERMLASIMRDAKKGA